jgi:hypothetical protein
MKESSMKHVPSSPGAGAVVKGEPSAVTPGFDLEDADDMFLRNVCWLSQEYTVISQKM